MQTTPTPEDHRNVTVGPLPLSPLHALGVAKLSDRVRSRFRVDAAGRAVLIGKAQIDGENRRVCRDEARVAGARTLTLVCRLSHRALERLQRHSLPLVLHIAFTPEGDRLAFFDYAITLPRTPG